jgi:hypothetical protein
VGNGGTEYLGSQRGKRDIVGRMSSAAPSKAGAAGQISQISAQLQAFRVNRPPSEEPQSEA